MNSDGETDTLNADHGSGHASATFILFSYNQEKFIREAARSALNQKDVLLEIILTDDCSTDQTFEILKKEIANYSGHHEVHLRQNTRNLGLIPHINKAISMARNDIVIVAAGDDVSMPARAKKIVEIFEREAPLLVHSRAAAIDASGNDLNLYEPNGKPGKTKLHGAVSTRTIAGRSSNHLGATAAWHLDLFRKYGPIQFPAASEDAVMEFRAALEQRVAFIDDVLIKYRIDEDRVKFRPLNRLDRKQSLNRRLAAFDVREAVFLQRIADLETAPDHVEKRLRPILVRAVRKLKCCRDVHETGSASVLWRHRRYPLVALSAVLKELNFLRKVQRLPVGPGKPFRPDL